MGSKRNDELQGQGCRESDEIFSLSDKIAVMYEGKFTGIFNNGDHSLEEIGLMMSGHTEEDAVKEMSNV